MWMRTGQGSTSPLTYIADPLNTKCARPVTSWLPNPPKNCNATRDFPVL